MRTAAPLLALLLLALLAGCSAQGSGSTTFKGDEKAVAGVVSDLQTAATGRKADKICSDLLTRALAKSLQAPGSDCVREVDKSIRDADDTELKVLAVTVTGATAQARVKGRVGGRTSVTVLGLAREDGKWRVAKLP